MFFKSNSIVTSLIEKRWKKKPVRKRVCATIGFGNRLEMTNFENIFNLFCLGNFNNDMHVAFIRWSEFCNYLYESIHINTSFSIICVAKRKLDFIGFIWTILMGYENKTLDYYNCVYMTIFVEFLIFLFLLWKTTYRVYYTDIMFLYSVYL